MSEHHRPNGNLSQGYFCMCCGKPSGMYRHDDYTANPKLVQACRKANPPRGMKPHFKLDLK